MSILGAPSPPPGWFVRHDIPPGWAAVIAALTAAVVAVWWSWRKDRELRQARRIRRLSETLRKMAKMVWSQRPITREEVNALHEQSGRCAKYLRGRWPLEKFRKLVEIMSGSQALARATMSQDRTGGPVWSMDRNSWAVGATAIADQLDEITKEMGLSPGPTDV